MPFPKFAEGNGPLVHLEGRLKEPVKGPVKVQLKVQLKLQEKGAPFENRFIMTRSTMIEVFRRRNRWGAYLQEDVGAS